MSANLNYYLNYYYFMSLSLIEKLKLKEWSQNHHAKLFALFQLTESLILN